MPHRPKCAACGNDAIGVQSFGCCTAFVCGEHAHDILRALSPGKHYSSGDCTFVRFGPDCAVPENGAGRRQDCG